MTDFISDAAAIIGNAREAAAPDELDTGKVYGVNLEGRYETLDLERFLPRPRRPSGEVLLEDADSLVAYLAELHAARPAGRLYADRDDATVTAVLNDHAGVLDAGWRDLTATLALQRTDPWLHWSSQDGKLLGQVDFAEHVEAGLDEILDPAAADMLELAQTFEAHQSVAFKSGQLLATGARVLKYEETLDARAGAAGQITIPKELRLGLRPFEGTEVREVVARLRYRLERETLRIGYQLVRPKDVLRAAFDEAAKGVADRSGLLLVVGDPQLSEG